METMTVMAGPNSFCFMNFMAWGPFLCTRLGRLLELRVLGREDTELLSGGGEDAEGGVGGLEELDGRAWANMKRRLGASSWKKGGLISRMLRSSGATSVMPGLGEVTMEPAGGMKELMMLGASYLQP